MSEETKVEDKKITYHFTMVRRTGEEEQVTVQFNGYEGETKENLTTKLTDMGDILDGRVEQTNKKLIALRESAKKSQVDALLAKGDKK